MKCAKIEKGVTSASTTTYETLQSYMQTLQFFDDTIDDYIYIYDLAAERVYFTDKIRQKFPLPPAGSNGNKFSDWNDLVYPKDRELMNHYRNLLSEKKITSFEIPYRLMDKHQWKQFGIKVSIDDFGTGYSSLSYLKSIEIDEVKIDRCFVNRIQYNAYNYRLLSNMIELAHSAQITVCCEGVETVDELLTLQELHADLQQPCEFCTRDKLSEDEFYVWELEDQFLNRHYILKEKLIPWQGKIARLKIAIDITEKEFVSKSIQKRLEFEKAIVDSCKTLARESDSKKSDSIPPQNLLFLGCCRKNHWLLQLHPSRVCIWVYSKGHQAAPAATPMHHGHQIHGPQDHCNDRQQSGSINKHRWHHFHIPPKCWHSNPAHERTYWL